MRRAEDLECNNTWTLANSGTGPNSPNPRIQIRVVQDQIMERLLCLFKENQQKDTGIKIALGASSIHMTILDK